MNGTALVAANRWLPADEDASRFDLYDGYAAQRCGTTYFCGPGTLRMTRKYFGTDGIRGRANGVITPDLAMRVGQAAGVVFRRGEHRHRVLIGKDTRLSGYMIETALVAGFTSVG